MKIEIEIWVLDASYSFKVSIYLSWWSARDTGKYERVLKIFGQIFDNSLMCCWPMLEIMKNFIKMSKKLGSQGYIYIY